MAFWASIIGVIFALLAATLWAWSALVNLPVIGSSYGAIANLDPKVLLTEQLPEAPIEIHDNRDSLDKCPRRQGRPKGVGAVPGDGATFPQGNHPIEQRFL
jgi:hypothetical protein